MPLLKNSTFIHKSNVRMKQSRGNIATLHSVCFKREIIYSTLLHYTTKAVAFFRYARDTGSSKYWLWIIVRRNISNRLPRRTGRSDYRKFLNECSVEIGAASRTNKL